MEDGFLELIFKLDLEEPMLVLRRKDMRRAEKYSYDRQYQCVNQVRYKTAPRDPIGAWRAYGSSNGIQKG